MAVQQGSGHGQAARVALIGVAIVGFGCPGCTDATGSAQRNDLQNMQTARITIGEHEVEVWLALTGDERNTGLMNVRQDELVPLEDGTHRGMLFVFEREQMLSFWMKNTITPLDIAYIQEDGRIVKTHAMAPLETRIYPSIEPAKYALEVAAGLWDEWGIQVGAHVEIPESVLKATP